MALLLAGCGNPDEPAPGIPLDESGGALPNLEGFVVDEAVRPMEGAVVRILLSNVTTTTDADGHYAIWRPTFLAETVLLSAAAPGYQPRTQQVQLSGQRSTRMDFRLDIDPYQVPHVEVLDHAGSLGCQAQVGAPVQRSLSCGAPDPTTLGESHPPPSAWDVWPDPGLAGLVVEVYWDAETDLARELHASLRGPMCGGPHGSQGDVLVEARGPIPLRLEVPTDAARALSRYCAIVLEVTFPDGQGAAPVAVSREQRFDAYATIFYVDPAPPGYTLA